MNDLNEKKETNDNDTSSTKLINTIFRRDTEEYKIIKKLPKRFPTRQNDIYITNKTDFKVQLQKCNHILFDQKVNETESNEIILHAIGPAINRFLFIINKFFFFILNID